MMNKKNIVDDLIRFGVNPVQAEIYVYLIKNGPKTRLELSREAGIERSKVYREARALEEKGLVVLSNHTRGSKLQAAPVESFDRIFKDESVLLKAKELLLPSITKELKRVLNIPKVNFEVKYYSGMDGVKQMLWNQLEADTRILAYSYENKNDMVGRKFAEKVRSEQLRRKIKLYEIENEVDQENYWYTDVKGWEKYYESKCISPDVLEVKQYISVFNNTVSVINWLDGELAGVEILNETYATTQKQLFWNVWNSIGWFRPD